MEKTWNEILDNYFSEDDSPTIEDFLDYLKDKEPWDYDDKYLLTLCKDCHEDVKEEVRLYESRILSNFRLKLKDTFVQNCTVEVFEKYENIDTLFYLLWDLKKYCQEYRDLKLQLERYICLYVILHSSQKKFLQFFLSFLHILHKYFFSSFNFF